jgi:phosphoglycerol transferase MdoB-like AlkP superfamily enzyme
MEFVAANAGPDYFGQHYVPPAEVVVQGAHPKNLILIYVESLEAGYSDRAVFGDDLIAPLTKFGARSFDISHFDQFAQVPGTGWTIAAMVATQCGVPLKRTVDSHEPFGHLSRSCARRGHAGFEGVIRCSAGDIAAFVEHVAARGYLLDTNIVILGDHLARRNPLTDKLARLPARSLFNAFIGAAVPERNRTQLVHFDFLPTILEFSGFTVDGGRLGLGYSAFNQHAVGPAPQRLRALRASVMNRSDSYRALWIAVRP